MTGVRFGRVCEVFDAFRTGDEALSLHAFVIRCAGGWRSGVAIDVGFRGGVGFIPCDGDRVTVFAGDVLDGIRAEQVESGLVDDG